MTKLDTLTAAISASQAARKALRLAHESKENVTVWGPLQKQSKAADEAALKAAWEYVQAVKGGGGGGLRAEDAA